MINLSSLEELLPEESSSNEASVTRGTYHSFVSATAVHYVIPDGATVPVPIADSLVDAASLKAGDRVVLMRQRQRQFILGKSGGEALATRMAAVEDKVAPLDFLWISTGTHSHNPTWAEAATLPEWGVFNAGSKLKIFYHVPYRNDSGVWGGLYIEPQIRLKPEGGGWSPWRSFGSNGYGLMISGAAQDIVFYNNTLLFTPDIGNVKYSAQLRFYMKSYDGVTNVNVNNDLGNIGSGTATHMTGDNGNQNYFHTIVEEKPQ